MLFVLGTFSYFLVPPLVFSLLPIDWLFEYESVEPAVARVGEPLVFASLRHVGFSGFDMSYVDTLYCNSVVRPDAEYVVGTSRTFGVSVRSAKEPTYREWPFLLNDAPYIPLAPRTCRLQSRVTMHIRWVDRSRLYYWSPFDIEPAAAQIPNAP